MKAASGREACFAIDAEQQVIMWSPAAEAILGFEAAEALGRPCCQVLNGSDVFGRPLYCDQCRACLHARVPVAPPAHHFLLRHRDGRLVRLMHELVPLPFGPGARAMVMLGETSTRSGPPPDSTLGSDGPPGALSSFADILKALAALGLVTDSVSSFSFYQTLDSTLDRVLNMTGSESAEVFLWNRANKEMCLTAHRGLFRSAFRQISRFERNEGYPGLVASTGQPLVTHELLQDPRFLRTRVKEKGVRFYMSVPLLSARGVLGCLNIASRSTGPSDDTLLQLLFWLAAPLASAAELTLLRSQETVEYLAEGETPISGLPGQVLKAMIEASEAEEGLIALWGPDTSGFLLIESKPQQVTPCLTEGAGLSCPACKLGQPLVFSGKESPGRGQCRESLGASGGAICVPIIARETTLGVASLRFRQTQSVPTRPLALLGAIAPRVGRVLLGVWPLLKKEHLTALDGAPIQATRERPPSLVTHPEAQPKGVTPELEQAGRIPFMDIRCFGSFQVLRDGTPLTPAIFGRRQSFTVFKVLVTRRGRPVSAEFLAEALWPEAYPEAASKRLWVVIHSLRMGLEPGLKSGQNSHFVLRDGDFYTFNPEVPYRLDVEDFLKSAARGERLEIDGDPRGAVVAYEEAASFYRGDFLEEEAYSDWCSAEREYLREVYLTFLKRLAALYTSWEEWDRSIRWHRQALFVDSLREEIHRELMRGLWRAGRRDEALRQYLECRQVLSKELGVEPLPETEHLYLQILEEAKKSP